MQASSGHPFIQPLVHSVALRWRAGQRFVPTALISFDYPESPCLVGAAWVEVWRSQPLPPPPSLPLSPGLTVLAGAGRKQLPASQCGSRCLLRAGLRWVLEADSNNMSEERDKDCFFLRGLVVPRAWTFRKESDDFFQGDIPDLPLHDPDRDLKVFLDGTGGRYPSDPRTRVFG